MKTCTLCKLEKMMSYSHLEVIERKLKILGVKNVLMNIIENETGLKSSCKECDKKLSKKYNDNNKESVNNKNKEYYLNNIEYHKNRSKEYKENNKEFYSEYNKNYKKKRCKNDELFRFTTIIRRRINSYLKKSKDKKAEEIIKLI